MGGILSLLRSEGLVYEDEHFQYTSGKHGSAYVDLRPLFPQAGITYTIAHRLVDEVWGRADFNVVIGPDFGGNELAEMVAAVRASEGHEDIKVVRTRKKGKGFVVHPGRHYEQHLPGCRALVVEDVCTTGYSTSRIIALVNRHGGMAVAVASVVDRSGLSADNFGVGTYTTLERVPMEAYPQQDCPYCRMGRPMVLKPGHGEEFRRVHPRYKGGFKSLT